MAGLAPQIREETTQGEARILQLFPTKERQGSERVVVAGCRVDSGSIKHGEQFRVLRGEEVVWTGICRSMKRHKLEVRQVGKVRTPLPTYPCDPDIQLPAASCWTIAQKMSCMAALRDAMCEDAAAFITTRLGLTF